MYSPWQTSEEFVRVMNGYKMNANKAKCGKYMVPLNVDLSDLPAAVDWRDKGYVTEVKNQVCWDLKWASSWDCGTYHICDQRRLRRACASAQSRQSLRCSHPWSMEVDEGSDQQSDI